MSSVYTIALTGGPCSGKTSTLPELRAQLNAWGLRVICVPEIVTMLAEGGLDPQEMAREVTSFETYETCVWRLQAEAERGARACAERLAERGASVVVIYDRALPDVMAYLRHLPEEAAQRVLTSHEYTPQGYDLVCHMETGAGTLGYTLANNVARSESAEQAQAVDGWVRQAWDEAFERFGLNAERVHVPAGPSFAAKQAAMLEEVLAHVEVWFDVQGIEVDS